MSDITRCDCCKGRKTVTGLGNMIKKCLACNGVGHVAVNAVACDVVKIDKRFKSKRG